MDDPALCQVHPRYPFHGPSIGYTISAQLRKMAADGVSTPSKSRNFGTGILFPQRRAAASRPSVATRTAVSDKLDLGSNKPNENRLQVARSLTMSVSTNKPK
jgi:hypothetical protein